MAEAKFQIPEDGVLVNVDPAFGLGLTRKEAAKRLGLSVETLRHMEDLGIGPRVIRLTPRKAFYPEDDLADWVASRAKGGRFVTQLVSPWSQLTSPRRQDTDARGFLYAAASGRLSPYGGYPVRHTSPVSLWLRWTVNRSGRPRPNIHPNTRRARTNPSR